MRLSEPLYTVKKVGEDGMHMNDLDRLVGFTGAENSCLPAGLRESPKQLGMLEEPHKWLSGGEARKSSGSILSNHVMYVDLDISPELRSKVELNCL